MDTILADRDYAAGSRVAVLVNGLGATPKEELYILYRRVAERLAERQLTVHRVWVGEYATSLEMAGASVSIMALDDALAALVDAPVSTPFVVQAE
jgi:dihydroxyacetone kinase